MDYLNGSLSPHYCSTVKEVRTAWLQTKIGVLGGLVIQQIIARKNVVCFFDKHLALMYVGRYLVLFINQSNAAEMKGHVVRCINEFEVNTTAQHRKNI